MLKELTKADWLRMLDIPEKRIPSALILRGTRNLKDQYQAMLPFFSNILEIGSPNGIIEDVLIGDYEDVPIAFACVYGAPMASEIVHIFGMLGTKLVIQTGNCGALGDGLQAGDLFLATEAYCGEGASQYYKTDGKIVEASMELFENPVIAQIHPECFRIGRIYTTSALFAESSADIERWYQQGYAAVDMETAATFAVAEHFGMQRMSILFVFDNPRQNEHLLMSEEIKTDRRELGNIEVCEISLALAAST